MEVVVGTSVVSVTEVVRSVVGLGDVVEAVVAVVVTCVSDVEVVVGASVVSVNEVTVPVAVELDELVLVSLSLSLPPPI